MEYWHLIEETAEGELPVHGDEARAYPQKSSQENPKVSTGVNKNLNFGQI